MQCLAGKLVCTGAITTIPEMWPNIFWDGCQQTLTLINQTLGAWRSLYAPIKKNLSKAVDALLVGGHELELKFSCYMRLLRPKTEISILGWFTIRFYFHNSNTIFH